MCSVFLPKEDRVVNILGEHLEPVVPEQGEKVTSVNPPPLIFLCCCNLYDSKYLVLFR